MATAPACESLSDEMATFLGAIQDLLDTLAERASLEEEHCRHSLEAYGVQAAKLEQQTSVTDVMLANTVSERGDLDALRQAKRSSLQDISAEADMEVGTCATKLKELEGAMCGARKLRREVEEGGTVLEGFMGDCEVTEWVRGPCTESCGGGIQNITREVISKPETGEINCPPLKMSHTCNTHACPVDGKMGAWGPWSECSRACGGGVRLRHREIVTRTENGGVPTGETVQEGLCNTHACDADCELSEWGEWSNCSKVCDSGHEHRLKYVTRPEVGTGTCPSEESPERRESRACNTQACPASPLPTCGSFADIVTVLDSSGSVGADNWAKAQQFVSKLIARVQLGSGDEGVQVGIVSFGSHATEVSPLSATASTLTTKATSMAWQKANTNTAEALVKAENIFLGGRNGATQTIVLLAEGMPVSTYLMEAALKLLKEKQIRLFIISVGHVDTSRLESWASWPTEENFMEVNFQDLDEDAQVTRVLANICPELE